MRPLVLTVGIWGCMVVQAVAMHVMSQLRQLGGNLIQPGIAIKNHVLAHVAALAEKSDAHVLSKL